MSEAIAEELRKAEFTYLARRGDGGEETRKASFGERLLVVEDPPEPVTRKVAHGRIRTPAEVEMQAQIAALTEARAQDLGRIEALENRATKKAKEPA